MIPNLNPGSLFNQIGNQKVMALTWRQPYGLLMLPPFNKIETRVWNTSYRGWVLICAGAVPYLPWQIQEISGNVQYRNIIQAVASVPEKQYAAMAGHAIGIGWLANSRLMQPADANRCFVGYNETQTRWCHVYENVRPIKPIRWKGKQGWWNVPVETIKQIIVL